MGMRLSFEYHLPHARPLRLPLNNVLGTSPGSGEETSVSQ